MERLERYRQFERLYQVVSWIGTLGLILMVMRSTDVLPSTKPALFLIAALLGITSILMSNLLPIRHEGRVRYGPEDKVLVESLIMIILLTAFLYRMPITSSGFFLLLVPILIETVALHERVLLAEAGFATVSIVFLRIGSVELEPFVAAEFAIDVAIFFSIVALMAYLTRLLRKRGERNDVLSDHLSKRLDQIQVISTVVRQSEFFPDFDRLLGRIGEIVTDAFDVEQCGFFLEGDDRSISLHPSSVGFDDQDRRTFEIRENLMKIEEAMREKGTLIVNGPDEKDGLGDLIGDKHLRNFVILPLTQGGERKLGLIMIANRRSGSFDGGDADFLRLLTEFISTLIESAFAFRRVQQERESAQRMSRLLVGREIKMKELKRMLKEKRS